MSSDFEFYEGPIFEYIAKSIESFCREQGITIWSWYHDEPRWLLRWGGDPLRQIEIRVEGKPSDYRLVLIPSMFETRDKKGWHTGNTYHVAIKPNLKAPPAFFDSVNPVDLKKFREVLRDAFDEANGLAGVGPGGSAPKRTGIITAGIQRACDKLRNVMPDDIARHQIDNWLEGKSTLDAALHSYDILENLGEIEELKKRNSLHTWFFRRPALSISPKDAGVLLAPYVVWEDEKLHAFSLIASSEPTICAVDTAIRIVTNYIEHEQNNVLLKVRKNGNKEVPITIDEIDDATANFIKPCSKDGFLAYAPNGRASVFSTFAGVTALHNLSSRPGRSKCGRLLKDMAPQVQGTLNKCLIDWNGGVNGGLSAFVYQSSGPPCLSADHYGLRTLAFLAPDERRGRDKIYGLFEEIERSGHKKAFLDFVKFCWNPYEGGYAWSPNKAADVSHARYALQVLRTLLSSGVIEPNDITWFNASAIEDYVMSCYSDGGFAITPGEVPLLYTTRAGINCIKLLEIFRLKGIFMAGHDYLQKRSQLERILANIPEFVSSCIWEDGFHEFSLNAA